MSMRSWIQDRPHALEVTYQLAERVFLRLDPLFSSMGYDRVGRLMRPVEQLGKELVFDCRMCGQCILHSTGMTCPMTCPKNLRNGPCGGVRSNGHCEVKPEMKCVWTQACERSLRMSVYGHEMTIVQPPVNRQLKGTSAWVNMVTGVDREMPKGWESMMYDA